MGWTHYLADSIGVAEDGLRLILGMMFVYPVMLVHNLYIKRQSATVQHLYFLLSGVALAAWTIGYSCVMHSFICILVTYVTLAAFGGNVYTAGGIFVFQMAYLSAGYALTASLEYVIIWTMPHCVLCLRLIGVAMDCYDGSRPEPELSKDQKATRLQEVPSLLEMCSHTFFPGSYFVGPQHSMTKYRNFIQRNIQDGDMSGSLRFGTRRLLLGWLYIVMHLGGSLWVPHSFVMSPEFKTLPFWKMSFFMLIWTKSTLAKYIAAWLFSEGACIFSGLAYNGRKEDGSILWDGGANVKLRKFEYCYNFGQVIESFNINTNAWCMNYVYKRCRFLNNKLYSQVVTMVFLAIWHGFHSGYYLTFLHEILVIQFEKQFFAMTDKSRMVQQLNQNPVCNLLFKVVGKFYVAFFLPHCFMPFVVLKSSLYLPLLWATRAPVFVFFGTWPLWKIPLAAVLKPVSTNNEKKTH